MFGTNRLTTLARLMAEGLTTPAEIHRRMVWVQKEEIESPGAPAFGAEYDPRTCGMKECVRHRNRFREISQIMYFLLPLKVKGKSERSMENSYWNGRPVRDSFRATLESRTTSAEGLAASASQMRIWRGAIREWGRRSSREIGRRSGWPPPSVDTEAIHSAVLLLIFNLAPGGTVIHCQPIGYRGHPGVRPMELSSRVTESNPHDLSTVFRLSPGIFGGHNAFPRKLLRCRCPLSLPHR